MIGIEETVKTLRQVFENSLRTPANSISGIIMALSLSKRPGLSTILSTGNILQSLSKQGIPTDNLPDGTPSLMNKMVSTVVDEVFRALREDANVQVAFEPMSINVTVNGANAGGPVTSIGSNTNYAKGVAVIQ
jgi:hypothetical protein